MHCVTEKITIGTLLIEKNIINDSSPYQRGSAVWSPEKQQLFMDSPFNELNIPKIYFGDILLLKGLDKKGIVKGFSSWF